MKVALDSGAVNDSDFVTLHEHGFNDEDIWDIGAVAAFFGLSNRMANMTGMRPNDEFYLMGRVAKQKQ
jgi:alkylhydroperoxidase family enzyme